jgi:hypothetical protein
MLSVQPLDWPIRLGPLEPKLSRDGVWEADGMVPDSYRVYLALGIWYHTWNWRQTLPVDEQPIDVLDRSLDPRSGW